MSYSYVEDYRGGTYVVEGEGTAQAPINFQTLYENLKGLISGLWQVPKNYGAGTLANPYELCENNSSEWTSSGDVGTPTDEAVDYKYNSYSIKGTKTGSDIFAMLWNYNNTYENWDNSSIHWFGLAAARIMKFSIKPSVEMTLDQIDVFAGDTTTTYLNSHTNDGSGWTLSSGVWNDFEIEISEFDDPATIFNGNIIAKIGFNFSGGTTSDTILIDGLTFERDDCDVKKLGFSMYEFCFRVALNDCYFKHDTQALVTWFVGSGYYGGAQQLLDVDSYQFDLGSSDDMFPVTIIINSLSSGEKIFEIAADVADMNIFNTQFIQQNWQWDKGVLAVSGVITPSGTLPYKVTFENCLFIIGKMVASNSLVLNNCDFICDQQPIQAYQFVADSENPTINGIRVFYKPSVYLWVDRGTLRDVKLYGWTEVAGVYNTFLYQRSYKQTIPFTTTLIDTETDGVDIDKLRIQQSKYWDNEDQRTVDLIIKWVFTMNMRVKDKDDVLSGATVTLYDKDENLIFEETTDIYGDIEEQEVITMENNFNNPGTPGVPGSGSFILEPWDLGSYPFNTIYQPFTLTIEKNGYQQYRDENFELWEPYEQVIALQPSVEYVEALIIGDLEEEELYGFSEQEYVDGVVTTDTIVASVSSI